MRVVSLAASALIGVGFLHCGSTSLGSGSVNVPADGGAIIDGGASADGGIGADGGAASDGGGPQDAGGFVDAGPGDSGSADAGPADAGPEAGPADAGSTDAGAPDGGTNAAAPYDLIDLGALANISTAGRINSSGVVGGIFGTSPHAVGILYDSRTAQPTQTGDFSSWRTLDDLGRVAGERALAATSGCPDAEVLVRSSDGTVQSLGTPPHAPFPAGCSDAVHFVTTMHANGFVVASWGGGYDFQAWLWSGGSWRAITGARQGEAAFGAAVNGVGHVVGDTMTHFGGGHAFLWRDGAFVDLGTLGGFNSRAAGLNDRDQVVGVAYSASQEQRAFLWQAGVMTDLGTPVGADGAAAVAINNAGAVVGASWSQFIGDRRATLWQDGVAYDLNQLVTDHHLHLSDANAINDSGAIVGGAFSAAGEPRGFLLLPHGPPSTAAGTPEDVGLARLTQGEFATMLALDDTRVYWVNARADRAVSPSWELRSALKAGGASVTLAAGAGRSTFSAPVLDGDSVWLSLCATTTCFAPDNRLVRIPKSGGAPVDFGSARSQLAVDDANVYFADGFGNLVRQPKSGGGRVVLASGVGDSALGVALSGGYVYFGATVDPMSRWRINRVPVLGGAVETVFEDGTWVPLRLNIDGGFLFVRSGGALYGGPLAGSKLQKIDDEVYDQTPDLDAHGGYVYWTNPCLHRAAYDGSGSACIAENPFFRYDAVRADETGVYYLRDGQVYRLSR